MIRALRSLAAIAGLLAAALPAMSAPRCDPGGPLDSVRLSRFYAIGALAKAAYDAGDFDASNKLATEYLELADGFRCDWNYGNAIHDGNRYLGLASLKEGDGDAAAAYLLKAGKSTGSPQLNTFGPDLDLADALLKEGRIGAVKQYLADIKRFWEMDGGRVDEWLAKIERGERPELNRFSYSLGGWIEWLSELCLAWPLLVTGAFLIALRRRIERKWLFAVTSVFSGYGAMMLAVLATAIAMPPITAMLGKSVPPVMTMLLATSTAGFIVALLVVFGLSRLFVVERRPPGAGSA